ncbi:MAG: hypothetical protein EPN57_03540 [Paraburkholderia sp.]|nr:MAG: hypothetical protein EPN57_03540 [Paraburkholderia sp.]
MEDLLPYYERELAYLRRYSEDFARRYPKIAGRLLPAGGYVDDPSIDQSIQAITQNGPVACPHGDRVHLSTVISHGT